MHFCTFDVEEGAGAVGMRGVHVMFQDGGRSVCGTAAGA